MMRAVVLAGGTGTRLHPLTELMNKHLLPIGYYPMIHYAMNKLSEAGIREALLITGKQSAGQFAAYLGGGESWGIRLTYKIQEQPGGIAQALSLAEDYIRPGEKFVVLLGDNLFEAPLSPYVEQYRKQPSGALVLLKNVPDPSRYGVPVLKDGRIVSIEEKPAGAASPYCVTGIYMYDSEVFSIIRSIRPSARGELEITDVNNVYAAKGELAFSILDGWWTDAGTHRSLFEAAKRFWDPQSRFGSGDQ
jgi:glucose-1-phosphate thymidylyltransferase